VPAVGIPKPPSTCEIIPIYIIYHTGTLAFSCLLELNLLGFSNNTAQSIHIEFYS
jgi:hypothetical protein